MSDGESARTVAQLLEWRAVQTPRAAAFQQQTSDGRWEPITWQDFSQRVATLRRGLSATGLKKGDRIALIAPVSLEWELLHHAALAMGVVVVAMDAHDSPERIAHMAEQAGVVAFATSDGRLLSQVGANRLAAVRFLLDLGQRGTSGAESCALPSRLNWAQFEALGDSTRPDPDPPAPNDIATIIFTSGTTGTPKGIAYTHAQVCLAVDAICEVFSFVGCESKLLCWLPLSNLFQRIVNLAAMRQGAATHLLGDPRRIMEVVAQVSPDVFIGVPRFYEKLYDGIRQSVAAQPPLQRKLVQWAWGLGRRTSRYRRQKRKAPFWLALWSSIADRLILGRLRRVMGRRLRCMVAGSAPTPQYLLEEFHALGWLVLEAYGLSENVLPMAMNRIDDFRFGTVGRPLPGNDIVVADDGLISVRGPGVFAGYLGEEDRPPLDSDGYYRTGDLGRFDADGYLTLTGRTSDLIKTSTGRRIAPANVEAQLQRVTGIEQAVLIGSGRKCLIVLCSAPEAGQGTQADKARTESLREQVAMLSDGERPRGIVLIRHPFTIDRGEITTNLKLKRGVIEEHHASQIDRLYDLIDRREVSPDPDLIVL